MDVKVAQIRLEILSFFSSLISTICLFKEFVEFLIQQKDQLYESLPIMTWMSKAFIPFNIHSKKKSPWKAPLCCIIKKTNKSNLLPSQPLQNESSVETLF